MPTAILVCVAGRLLRALGVFALVAVGLPAPLTAQPLTGTIDGTVRHLDGRSVVGAHVVAIDERGAQRDAYADQLGYFRLTELPPGCYVVRLAGAPPFAPVQSVVALHPRQTLGVALRIGALQLQAVQPVTVRSEAAPLDLGDIGGATFGRDAIDGAPLARGRTMQSFQDLVLGVTVTDSVGNLAQFTAGGQRRFTNRLTIDGIGADLAVDVAGPGLGRASGGTLPASSTSGGTQTLVPLAAVDEITVRVTNASPAAARAPGAQTSIVTRAGGDTLRGDVFAEGRPNRLTASTWFANAAREPRRDLHAVTAGAALGGPIIRERLFGLAAFERQSLNRPQHADMRVPSAELRATSDLLASLPAPNGPSGANGLATFSGRFRAASALRSLSVRADGVLSPRQRLFLRVQRGTSSGDELGPYLLHGRAFDQRETTATASATAGWTQTFASALHDLRANYTTHAGAISAGHSEFGRAFDRSPFVGASDAWLSLTLHADPGGGGIITNGSYTASRQRHIELTDTWTAAFGRHTVQTGAEIRHTLTASAPPLNAVSLRYPSLQAFVAGAAPLALLDRHLPVAVVRDGAAFYAQDTVRLPVGATLTYGLRYAVSPAPRSANAIQPSLMTYAALPTMEPRPSGSRLWKTAWGNIAPQVGLAVRLSSSTNARAGWARAFDDNAGAGMLPFGRGYPYSSRRGIASAVLPLALDATTAPYAPDMLAEHYAYTDDFRPAHTDQWHVGVDRQLGASHGLSVMYVGARGRDLAYWHAFYPLAPRQTTSVQAFSTDGKSSYHALLTEFTRRLSKGIDARATYTWAHSLDIDSGESQRPQLPPSLALPRSNWGNSDFDRRHNARVQVSLALPDSRGTRGWLSGARLDIVTTLISGQPVSIMEDRQFSGGVYFTRVDRNGGEPLWLKDPNAPDGRRLNREGFSSPNEARQGNQGRNQIRGRGVRQVDAALSKTARFGARAALTFRISVFNLFNVANFGPPVGVYGEPLFGTARQAYADALGTGTLTYGGLPSSQQIGGPRSVQFAVRMGY